MEPSIPEKQELDDELALFIQRYVSINVATSNTQNKPFVTRAYGCKVSHGNRLITLYINPSQNDQLIRNIGLTHLIAAVFSSPSTHRTVQLKGADAKIVALTSDDYSIHDAYKESMIQELQSIGYPASFASALIHPIDERSIGIQFSPQQAFLQTPGPDAGKRIAI